MESSRQLPYEVLDLLQEVLEPGLVTGFILFVDHIDEHGEQRWWFATAPGQTLMVSLGLTAQLQAGLLADAQDNWREMDNDE